jgi:hypothetical protein
MTARPREFPGAEFELWLERVDAERLEAELRAIQSRLGTPAEGPHDFACAQAIAHRLNNLITTRILRQNAALLASWSAGAAPRPPPGNGPRTGGPP